MSKTFRTAVATNCSDKEKFLYVFKVLFFDEATTMFVPRSFNTLLSGKAKRGVLSISQCLSVCYHNSN